MVNTAELPADFLVWTSTAESDFPKGKVLWLQIRDVEELVAKKAEVEGSEVLTLRPKGWVGPLGR